MEPDQMKRVEALLSELETLLSSEGTSDDEAILGALSEEEKSNYDVMDEGGKEEFMKAKKAEGDKTNGEKAEEKDDIEKAEEKDDIEKAEDATTGSDDTEAIIDELPEVTEDNVKEVAKMLRKLKNAKVEKSKQEQFKKSELINKNISSLTRVVKQLVENQGSLEKGFENFMDAQGIKSEVMKEFESNQNKKVEKSANSQTDEISRGIAEAFRQLNSNSQPFANTEKEIEKSIGDDSKSFLTGFKNFFPK